MMLPVKILPPSPEQGSSPTESPLPPQRFLQPPTSSHQGATPLSSLLIGVSSFGQGLSNLPGAPRDTYRLFLELSHSAKYPQVQTQPLTNPTRQQCVKALQSWCRELKNAPQTTAFLYLSTHGCYVDGSYHLCMSDSSFQQGSYHQTLSWAELRTWLAPLQHHTLIVMLDSCRNISHSITTSSVPRHREDIVLRGETWAVCTAASFGALAQEVTTEKQGPHGLFTHALLQSLQGWTPQEPLRLRTLYNQIKQNLERYTTQQKLTMEQEPRLYVGHIDVGESVLLTPQKQSSSHTCSSRKTALVVGLTLLFAALAGLLLFSADPSNQHTCRSCIQKRWSQLRLRDCKAVQPLPSPTQEWTSNCSLPCNQANFKAVISHCWRSCQQQSRQVRMHFKSVIEERTSKQVSLSLQQCIALLPQRWRP
ncbi:MAG: caspase family protein [Deltaproteobacteria bacterium]|nr:MAG: caspase family protein [Deltaproteobacteria bacterium]